MPKRQDIKKVLIIGSGPIVIGQACEFDYSGTQACKALMEEDYEVVLVNSNPATIMTDPEMADRTYIEPLTIESVEKVIEKEKPDALLPNLGGQTALNLSSELFEEGILDKYGVEIIGIQTEAIKRGEDRIAFKETMQELGVPMPESHPIYSVEEAEKVADELGYPVVLRPAYTMGGTGGGLVFNIEELREVAERGLNASMIGQVLVEESVLGWKELELELVRDYSGHKISVCFIENVDSMGIHTGDSFCVAPMLTVSERVQRRLEEYCYRIADAIGVIGGANVQFAYNPEEDRLAVIEMNPRTSRSSALASKATGFPIARISTKLAVGLNLEELPYWKEGSLDKYEPSGDYVVVKFARWAFEKFPQEEDRLGTQMKAVGEAMSIGKNFKEAFHKAIRSLEIGRYGLGNIKKYMDLSPEELKRKLLTPSSERVFFIYEALRRGISVEEVAERTYINNWFLEEIRELAECEEEIRNHDGTLPDELLIRAVDMGFSDRYLSELLGNEESEIRRKRKELERTAAFNSLPVSGAEGEYYYSTFHAPDQVEAKPKEKKIMILGGGPNRIGQGIEFDYTCVHAAFALRDEGYESVMVNCNPETVSTDYDTSDKLYFEPLTVEDVLAIYEKEQPMGVIVQFGGQTPLNIARELEEAGVNILGTSPESIDFAEDREHFRELIVRLGIPQPESDIARSLPEARAIADRIGYPLVVRPSYVLGGRGMEIVYDEESLNTYVKTAVEEVSPDHPILIDKFLEHAIEAEVDAISDGEQTYVGAVMEHIEEAGIHSGDSACCIPPRNITGEQLKVIEEYTSKIARELNVIGLMNIQYAIADDEVYILEANPRASRTVPLVSKITGVNMAQRATRLMLDDKLSDLPPVKKRKIPYFGVKEAVFPFNMFNRVDPLLGPEMKATGEVLGISDSFGLAFYKAQEGSGFRLPQEGTVLITVADKDKPYVIDSARRLQEMDFRLLATSGTCSFLAERGIECEQIDKLHEGRPNILDSIKNGEIQLIINTPVGKESKTDDSYIRSAAIRYKIPYLTTTTASRASVEGIANARRSEIGVKAVQDYHRNLEESEEI